MKQAARPPKPSTSTSSLRALQPARPFSYVLASNSTSTQTLQDEVESHKSADHWPRQAEQTRICLGIIRIDASSFPPTRHYAPKECQRSPSSLPSPRIIAGADNAPVVAGPRGRESSSTTAGDVPIVHDPSSIKDAYPLAKDVSKDRDKGNDRAYSHPQHQTSRTSTHINISPASKLHSSRACPQSISTPKHGASVARECCYCLGQATEDCRLISLGRSTTTS